RYARTARASLPRPTARAGCGRPRRLIFFFFQAEDGIRGFHVTGVQTCALPICKTDQFFADMERHLRHRFYEARDEIKQVLASLTQEPEVLPGLFRLIRQTDEGWLAGELIHLCLAFEPEHLAKAVEKALATRDYLLQ